jgi:hypothetical protein
LRKADGSSALSLIGDGKMLKTLAAAAILACSLGVLAPTVAEAQPGWDRGHHHGWNHGRHHGWRHGHHYGWGRGHHQGWRHGHNDGWSRHRDWR